MEFDFRVIQLVNVILDIFRVGGDDRTVIMVDGVLKFLTLVWDTGVENVFHALFDQP